MTDILLIDDEVNDGIRLGWDLIAIIEHPAKTFSEGDDPIFIFAPQRLKDGSE